ncbi:hypothetical protein IAD21_06023 [Abditibacteriota bacterium]|nr:hypothetical protein IAD21_06023 [Abditibacteriota bacterium]
MSLRYSTADARRARIAAHVVAVFVYGLDSEGDYACQWYVVVLYYPGFVAVNQVDDVVFRRDYLPAEFGPLDVKADEEVLCLCTKDEF